MYKKFLSSILIIIYFFSFNPESFALSYENDKPYNTKKINENCLKQIDEARKKQEEKHLKEYGISCFYTPESPECSYLTVKIKDEELGSYLAKNYNAYNVTIKNNYEKPIEIVNLKGLFYQNPQEEISKKINDEIKERNKKRFPQSLFYLGFIPLGTALWAIMLPAVPLMFVMAPDDETIEFAKGPVYWLYEGTWYTLASPYYKSKDKKADKLAIQEAKNALNYSNLKLNPNEEIQLTILSFHRLQLRIQYKKEGEDTITKINYDRPL